MFGRNQSSLFFATRSEKINLAAGNRAAACRTSCCSLYAQLAPGIRVKTRLISNVPGRQIDFVTSCTEKQAALIPAKHLVRYAQLAPGLRVKTRLISNVPACQTAWIPAKHLFRFAR